MTARSPSVAHSPRCAAVHPLPRLYGAACTLTFAAAVAVTPIVARAQDPPPAVYAIVNARIEVGDGRVIPKGTVVLRNGLIEAVGADVKAPPDAETIAGDGLTVYPGFIDADLSDGLKLPDAEPDQDTPPDTGVSAPPYMREANRKGIRPELRAVDCLALTDDVLKPLRANGFATALLVPTGGMMNGAAGLVNLSGLPRRDCVVKPDAGLSVGFTAGRRGFGPGARGGYPGTLLGVFAEMRQTLLDAQRYALLQRSFAAGGGERPPDDPALAALQPVLSGTSPVLLDADRSRDVHRAVLFAGEFALHPIVCGGQEAFKETDLLAQQHVPVILGLDFGPEPGTRAAAVGGVAGGQPGGRARGRRGGGPAGGPPPGQAPPQAQAQTGAGSGSAAPETPPPASARTTGGPAEDADIPPAVLEDRKRLWREKVANAARLHDAGILFAFSTRGTRDQTQFWAAMRAAIKAGLPRDAALQALTAGAARLLGVDRQLGTLEPGKIASLTVMSGDFADAGRKVRYVFVDRAKFDLTREEEAAQ